jgi:sigma-E factor negative regulatory protein RseA
MTANDRDVEALSALMDGEAQELELRRSLDAIAGNPALRERWRRQQQISELLQSRRLSCPDVDVSERVAASLTDRPALSRNPLWSMAVAASVTFAVVMGGQFLVPSTEQSVSPLVSDIGGAVVPVMGAQPVQASLGAKSLPVANRQPQDLPTAARQVGAAYERLAQDRYRLLNVQHANQAARSHPAPYVLAARQEITVAPEAADRQ